MNALEQAAWAAVDAVEEMRDRWADADRETRVQLWAEAGRTALVLRGELAGRGPETSPAALAERVERLRTVAPVPECPHGLTFEACSLCLHPGRRLPIVTCPRCGGEIFWARTEKGSSMPVDAVPEQIGNVVVSGWVDRSPRVHVLRKSGDPLDGLEHYVPHFATCASALNREGVKR